MNLLRSSKETAFKFRKNGVKRTCYARTQRERFCKGDGVVVWGYGFSSRDGRRPVKFQEQEGGPREPSLRKRYVRERSRKKMGCAKRDPGKPEKRTDPLFRKNRKKGEQRVRWGRPTRNNNARKMTHKNNRRKKKLQPRGVH